VSRGGQQTFTATVAGKNSPAQTVNWSITTTGIASGTQINPAGLLTVAADETLAGITVKATATADTGKSGTATIAIPQVRVVSLTPATVDVQKGTAQIFNAVVSIESGAAQTVSWELDNPPDTPHHANTTLTDNLDNTATVFAALEETQPSLTVRARSNVSGFTGIAGEAELILTETAIPPAVLDVTITTASQTILRGAFGNFTALVAVQGPASDTVIWSLTGKKSDSTRLDTNENTATVNVAADETADTLTLRATAADDETKYHEISISIPQVSSVSINPASASVGRNSTEQFAATANGTGSPPQNVEWAIVESGLAAGTGIDESGLLSIGASETKTSLTVRATSGYDTSKSNTAAVTVLFPSTVTITITPNGSDISINSLTIAKGQTGTFTASIEDAASYAWYLNGIPVSGANTPSYLFDTTGINAGIYELMVVADKTGQTLSGRCSVKITN
jgi:hypothetical protein